MKVIVVLLIVSYIIFRVYKKNRRANETEIQPLTDINVSSTNSFNHMQVRRQGIQLLESLYILSTTHNLDILVGRMNFINQIYENIINCSQTTRYLSEVSSAVDEYKTRYYDRQIIDEAHLNLLLHPDNKYLKLFYSNCILECYARYVKRQKEEMDKLKTNAAKERRRDDIIKKGYSAKYMFKTYDLPDEGHLDSIEEMRKRFYSYQKLE
jgi:hypothetical protein